MSIGLDRNDIRALFDDLSNELGERGVRADLFLVGGAAIAVAYDAFRAVVGAGAVVASERSRASVSRQPTSARALAAANPP